MANRNIIAIGTSAGGVEALKTLVAGCPENLQAAIIVIMHLPAGGHSFLPQTLQDAGRLPASEPQDGEPIRNGHIYIAPADSHLLLGEGKLHLSRGPKEGRQRPSINVTFRSAAMSCRARVIGVVLTGMLDDGTAGLWEIKRRGGIAIVQDPDEAVFPSMPVSALREVEIDYQLRLSDIGPLLARLAAQELPHAETQSLRGSPTRFSGMTCPECHGPLWEHALGSQLEYRCRVGHAFSGRSLLHEQAATQERKLYEAIVALEEGAEMSEYIAARVDESIRSRLMAEAEQLRQHASSLREVVESRPVILFE